MPSKFTATSPVSVTESKLAFTQLNLRSPNLLTLKSTPANINGGATWIKACQSATNQLKKPESHEPTTPVKSPSSDYWLPELDKPSATTARTVRPISNSEVLENLNSTLLTQTSNSSVTVAMDLPAGTKPLCKLTPKPPLECQSRTSPLWTLVTLANSSDSTSVQFASVKFITQNRLDLMLTGNKY